MSRGIVMVNSGMRLVVGAAARNWRRMLFIGAVDVVAGIAALAWPGVTVLALAVLLGIMLLILSLITISVGRRTDSTWLTVLGVLALVAAVIVLVHPGAGVFAILLGCAIWFLLNGLSDLAAASAPAPGRLWWGLLGLLSVAAAVIMIASPGVAIVTVSVIVGISFLIRGAGELMLGWHLRRLDQALGGSRPVLG